MKGKSRKISVCAILSALTLSALYIGSVFPTGRVGLIAASSLFGIAAVIEVGMSGGAFVYVVSALLGALIIPDKSAVIFYALFFGYYPGLKSFAETGKNRVTEWIIKLLVMNAALTVTVFVFSGLVFDIGSLPFGTPILYAVVNAAFVLFDIGVTKLIGFYIVRISKNIGK